MHAGGAGLGKVQVRLKWDPSPYGEPARHLDIVAATYATDDPYGRPAYVVHTESRSPDGTINMTRHSETGLGLGYVEVMELEFERLSSAYGRVVVGVAIHQTGGPRTFADLSHAGVLVVEGYRQLLEDDFTGVADATAATIAEFTRDASGAWHFAPLIRGFESNPAGFMAEMGSVRG
ncbi:stress response protein SCP2 [Streptomyces sp. SAI-117]|jgi:tellurium resistance protein TerD|uniref:TerD family protein n=1 Tax=unclassified Streptomyces TaxID=2593676 RepID=UPI002475E161|nr:MULTISPECIES: TerD family protein [unclassified Streptomyces]MDH6568981.1 stress response protein SCP2 [Streptomyces sp. SAI-117]MDH6586065.1 stress response protein SCP2 [Streptomyces sp. SAI-133]